MAVISVTNMGDNSAVIEFGKNSTALELLTSIDQFIVAHGWIRVDADFWVTTTWTVMTYKAANKDGLSDKYIQVRYNAYVSYGGPGFQIYVYDTYNSGTKVGTNPAYLCNLESTAYRILSVTTLATGGYIYVFSTNRWLIMYTVGLDGALGMTYGSANSFMGTAETKLINAGDTSSYSPAHVWLTGRDISSGTYAVSYPRTRSGAVGSTAATNTRVVTSFGCMGINTGTVITNIPLGLNCFSDKHIASDLTAVTDTNLLTTFAMIKGPLYGIKIFGRGIGILGGTVQVKCDEEFFVDPNGTDKEFFLLPLTDTNQLRFGIPL